jgi:hypothetical protein
MSQILTLELNDQIFAAIQQQAENMGIAPESLATKLLEQKLSQMYNFLLTDIEKQSRRAKFERHFGEIDLGYSIDLDNESIDADLAKEYSSPHE